MSFGFLRRQLDGNSLRNLLLDVGGQIEFACEELNGLLVAVAELPPHRTRFLFVVELPQIAWAEKGSIEIPEI